MTRNSTFNEAHTAQRVAFVFLGIIAGVLVTVVIDSVTDADQARRIQLNTDAIQSLTGQVVDRLARIETKIESIERELQERAP